MKKFFKRFRKKIACVALSVLIIIISCVYPFFTASAFAAEVTLFALGSLIWTVVGGILTGTAFDSAEAVTSAITEIYNDGLAAGNVTCIAFSSDPVGYTLAMVSYLCPLLLTRSQTATALENVADKITVTERGGISISANGLRDVRQAVANSASTALPLSVISNSSNLSGNPLFFYKIYQEYSEMAVNGLVTSLPLVQINGEWCYLSNNDSTSCTLIQFGFDGTNIKFYNLSVSPSSVNASNYTCFAQLEYASSIFLKYGHDYGYSYYRSTPISITSGSAVSVSSLPTTVSWVVMGTDYTDFSNTNTLRYLQNRFSNISDVEVPNNDLQNTIDKGQGLGVISENPTITFNPTTAEDGTTSVETLIDDVPVSDVENEIEDIQATADNIDGISGAISGSFPAIDLDIPIDIPAITDTTELQATLEAAIKAKFPVIEQATTLLNNLFCSSFSNEPPNFHFYWDSDGDGEKERYNALDLSFFETVLTNENLEDKSRFSNPITVRSLVQGFIILIFYVAFALKIIKLLPTVFGGAGEGISDFSNIVGDK